MTISVGTAGLTLSSSVGITLLSNASRAPEAR